MSSIMPSEGVYYVLFMPTGWTLRAYRFADMPETDHSTWWEQSLAQDVASEWSKSLESEAGSLARSLRLHYTGFPRGRVAKVGRKFHVYHGANCSKLAGQAKAVEQAFGIIGRAYWDFDEHEQSLKDDCEAVQGFLRISETWQTVQ